jgi:hypothetical protein
MRKVIIHSFIFFFLCALCSAQEREGYSYGGHPKFRALWEVFGTKGQNYEGMGVLGGVAGEVFLKHTTVTLRAGVDTLDKVDTHDGTTVRLDGSGYYNLSRHFFAGGGMTWGRLITSQYTKQSAYPYFGGGYGDRRFVLTGNYYCCGTDKINGVRGPRIEMAVPLMPKEAYFVTSFGFLSAYPTDCPTCARQSARDARLGLRAIF